MSCNENYANGVIKSNKNFNLEDAFSELIGLDSVKI